MSIQYLRAIACLLVAFVHAIQFSATTEVLWLFEHKSILASVGGAGVDIFFVLSGFIVFFITDRNHVTRSEFLLHRFYRIVPVYWFWTIVFFTLMSLFSDKFIPDYFHLLLSLMFVQSTGPDGVLQPVLNVGWTLNYEMVWYVAFALFLPMKGKIKNIFFLLGLLLILLFFSRLSYGATILEFFLGAIVYAVYTSHICKRLTKNIAYLLIVFGMSIIFVFADIAYHQGGWMRLFIWGGGASLLMLGMLVLEPFLNRSGGFVMFFKHIGDASYSIYLTHWFLGLVSHKVFSLIAFPVLVQVVSTFIAMVILGLLTYHLVEKNMIYLVKKYCA